MVQLFGDAADGFQTPDPNSRESGKSTTRRLRIRLNQNSGQPHREQQQHSQPQTKPSSEFNRSYNLIANPRKVRSAYEEPPNPDSAVSGPRSRPPPRSSRASNPRQPPRTSPPSDMDSSMGDMDAEMESMMQTLQQQPNQDSNERQFPSSQYGEPEYPPYGHTSDQHNNISERYGYEEEEDGEIDAPPQQTDDEVKKELMRRMYFMQLKGEKVKRMTMTNTREEIETAYGDIMHARRARTSIKFYKQVYYFLTWGIEKAATTIGKGKIRLKDWNEAVSANIDSYDPIFEEIYFTHEDVLGSFDPVLKLAILTIASAAVYHANAPAEQTDDELVDSFLDRVDQDPALMTRLSARLGHNPAFASSMAPPSASVMEPIAASTASYIPQRPPAYTQRPQPPRPPAVLQQQSQSQPQPRSPPPPPPPRTPPSTPLQFTPPSPPTPIHTQQPPTSTDSRKTTASQSTVQPSAVPQLTSSPPPPPPMEATAPRSQYTHLRDSAYPTDTGAEENDALSATLGNNSDISDDTPIPGFGAVNQGAAESMGGVFDHGVMQSQLAPVGIPTANAQEDADADAYANGTEKGKENADVPDGGDPTIQQTKTVTVDAQDWTKSRSRKKKKAKAKPSKPASSSSAQTDLIL